MRLFKKRENKKNHSRASNKPFAAMGAICIKMQQAWVKWMERRTENLNHNQWLLVLGLFVLLTGGYSSYLFTDSVLSNRKMVFSIHPIQKTITATFELKYKPDSVGIEKEYQKINRFRMYLDSLKRSPKGKVEYDRMILLRPGLMDSLNLIEMHYQSQKDKKKWNN